MTDHHAEPRGDSFRAHQHPFTASDYEQRQQRAEVAAKVRAPGDIFGGVTGAEWRATRKPYPPINGRSSRRLPDTDAHVSPEAASSIDALETQRAASIAALASDANAFQDLATAYEAATAQNTTSAKPSQSTSAESSTALTEARAAARVRWLVVVAGAIGAVAGVIVGAGIAIAMGAWRWFEAQR